MIDQMVCDLTEEGSFTEKELIKIVEVYPNRSILFVTKDQKINCAGFSGNSIRWTSVEGIHRSHDVLTWDSPTGKTFYIYCDFDFEQLGD